MRSAAVAFLLSSFIATGAAAAGPPVSSGSNFVVDGFGHLYLKPDERAYWWIANTGTLDGAYHVFYDYCGDATCVLPEREGGTAFARLELGHGAPGAYYCAELAELQTGFSYGAPMRWAPAVGHPVVMQTRLRFSANYASDGSGGAVGSAGVWLWNSPVDYVSGQLHPARAFGLSWVTEASVLAPGLAVTVYEDSWPTYVGYPSQPVDMQGWNSFASVWSVDAQGTQTVAFWLNAEFLGETPVYGGFDPLSVEIWNDNQHPEWEGIVLEDALESQWMDLDRFAIFQP